MQVTPILPLRLAWVSTPDQEPTLCMQMKVQTGMNPVCLRWLPIPSVDAESCEMFDPFLTAEEEML